MVVCFSLDEEIKEDLERQHAWLKIEEVYKLPQLRMIKFTCASSATAKRAIDDGLVMFSCMPLTRMHAEYTSLLACNRCHSVEEQPTSQCPKPADFRVFSECTAMDHNFRECNSSGRRCINCGQGHSARAMRCPMRKRARKEKQEHLWQAGDSRPSALYAEAAHISTTPISTSLHSTILICVLNAHL